MTSTSQPLSTTHDPLSISQAVDLRCHHSDDGWDIVILPPHTFCFAELRTSDPAAAADFYRGLFGWTLEPVTRTYSIFRLRGRIAAGLRSYEGKSSWVACLKVNNVDDSAVRLARRGATVEAAVTVPGVARTSDIHDVEGARLQLWEPQGVEGTGVDSGPGSLWWVELATANMKPAIARYTSLFGWTSAHTTKYENGPHGYTLFTIGERSTSGVFQFEPDWGVRSAWQVYFEVKDFEESAALACSLGGSDGFWRDAPNAGRIGVITDPAGATFQIAQPLTATSSP